MSKCEEVKGNHAPDVQLKASQRVAFEAFDGCVKHLITRDLVEEFLASGVWPLSQDWTIPEFGDKGPEELCRPILISKVSQVLSFITFLTTLRLCHFLTMLALWQT